MHKIAGFNHFQIQSCERANISIKYYEGNTDLNINKAAAESRWMRRGKKRAFVLLQREVGNKESELGLKANIVLQGWVK